MSLKTISPVPKSIPMLLYYETMRYETLLDYSYRSTPLDPIGKIFGFTRNNYIYSSVEYWQFAKYITVEILQNKSFQRNINSKNAKYARFYTICHAKKLSKQKFDFERFKCMLKGSHVYLMYLWYNNRSAKIQCREGVWQPYTYTYIIVQISINV